MKKMKKHLILLLSALLLTAARPSTAFALEEDEAEEDKLLAPYFVIQSEGADISTDYFPLKSTEVTTNINGAIAETYVVQTYENQGDKPINAQYVFPTSTTATVHGMTMEIGSHRVTATIKEKEEAKEEYEEAKEEGKSASLLEQKRPNVFTMDVANIMPGDTARIELHYTELITCRDGEYEFVFPTVVGPRYIAPQDSSGPVPDDAVPSKEIPEGDSQEAADASDGDEEAADDWAASPYLPEGVMPDSEYHINISLSTGVPIADVTCKSHEINVAKETDSLARITLADTKDFAGNRDFILKYRLTSESVQSGLVLTENNSEKYFFLTVQPPERFTPDDIPPREYIFVLDVSGSMYGYPLDTSKDLIRNLVSGLKETDTFNLVLFSDDTYLLAPQSLAANSKNIQKAIDLIDEQEGGGGTSMLPALTKALSVPMNEDIARSVVIITDGYISNEDDIYDLINQNMDTASFFSFGIGCSVNDYLIKGIAQCGMGESFLVTDSEDAESSAERFAAYIESPLLTGITVDYEGFDVYDVATATPSILYAQKPLILFGKWRGEPAGTITVSGKAGNEEYKQEISVADATVDAENESIRYLWARTKLDQLAGYGSVRNDDSVKEEITQLGLDYNMTTPYTSFVAVVDEIRNEEGESEDVKQASPLPLQVSNLAIGGGYTAYSEPGGIILGFILTIVSFYGILCQRRKKKRH
ncbi:VIT and vWA domain-containing protein [Acetatifactor aquisgranensis]|uniref:VIT and vWA domain-containing protein n=1 Tax=Acetatifactor aquisgranensis TaxID=2941233 RepID=UPI00204131AA|nr:VIT and VWA domain-containing protein [Acetatifactor aquisgranensis]